MAKKPTDLGDARIKKMANDLVSKKTKPHIVLGEATLKALGHVIFVGEEVWHYRDGLWQNISYAKAWLDGEIEIKCRELKLKSTKRLIDETRNWMARNPHTLAQAMIWDDHGKISVRSGLIDPKTGKLEKALPEHHVTRRAEVDFNPKAKCPMWLQMLADMFDQPTIDLIQEVLGMGLISTGRPKELSRVFIAHGASDTGKTQLVRIMVGLLTDNPIVTPLSLLDTPHGTSDFVRNEPWFLSEAFDQSKWHFSAMVKLILEGETIPVNRKNRAFSSIRYTGSAFWATNVAPQFKEATKAVINRAIIVSCKKIFSPKEAVGVALEVQKKGYEHIWQMILAEEKSGLLNWAIIGMQRAMKRGHYLLTEEVEEALHQVYLEGNMCAGWLEDQRAVLDLNYKTATADALAAYATYYLSQRGEDSRTPSSEAFTRALKALGLGFVFGIKSNGKRYIGGLRLTSYGLEDWQTIKNGNVLLNREIGLAEGRDKVSIPWLDAKGNLVSGGTITNKPPEKDELTFT